MSLWVYRILVALALPLAVPMLKIGQLLRGKSRPRFSDRMGRSIPEISPGGIWIQAVSVGEVELARRVVAEFEQRAQDIPLFVTATTATGLDLARRTLGDRLPVFPCPIDLPKPVARVLEAARPRLLVLVETELWPEMLHQAGRHGVPVAVVNARLSDGSYRGYRRLAGPLATLLKPVALVLGRSDVDARRFEGLGIPPRRVRVGGNIKYDLEADQRPLEWAQSVTAAASGRPIVVAGSTMEGEEEQVLDAVAAFAPGPTPFLVLAPRHPERFDAVAKMVAGRGLGLARRSAGGEIPTGTDVFLVDTIGELARAYRFAAVAIIGGSLVETGGHNPLEAAVWGVPVLSGPHVHNFREVYDEMTASGAARLVADRDDLARSLAAWIRDPGEAAAAGAAGRRVVDANRGATAGTVSALLELLGEG